MVVWQIRVEELQVTTFNFCQAIFAPRQSGVHSINHAGHILDMPLLIAWRLLYFPQHTFSKVTLLTSKTSPLFPILASAQRSILLYFLLHVICRASSIRTQAYQASSHSILLHFTQAVD